jgi:hypothetical protein
MAWIVSPLYKKHTTQIETWRNSSGQQLKLTTVWRWSSWNVGDEEPDLSSYDPDSGIDPYALGQEVELVSAGDGDEHWEYPQSWTDEDKERFHELWEELWHDAPNEMGFVDDDTDYWIGGPLSVEQEEYGSSEPEPS